MLEEFHWRGVGGGVSVPPNVKFYVYVTRPADPKDDVTALLKKGEKRLFFLTGWLYGGPDGTYRPTDPDFGVQPAEPGSRELLRQMGSARRPTDACDLFGGRASVHPARCAVPTRRRREPPPSVRRSHTPVGSRPSAPVAFDG